MVETDITKRWEQGIPHHPKSIELMEALMDIDSKLCDDHFCWKKGGDGDNGETLMYEMDIHFDRQDGKDWRDRLKEFHMVMELIKHAANEPYAVKCAILDRARGLIWGLTGKDPGYIDGTSDVCRVFGVPYRIRDDGFVVWGDQEGDQK